MKTNCKKCGAQIEFIKMKSGKFMPVNVEPYKIVVTDGGETARGRTSHYATCPFAQEFRKKGGEIKHGEN